MHNIWECLCFVLWDEMRDDLRLRRKGEREKTNNFYTLLLQLPSFLSFHSFTRTEKSRTQVYLTDSHRQNHNHLNHCHKKRTLFHYFYYYLFSKSFGFVVFLLMLYGCVVSMPKVIFSQLIQDSKHIIYIHYANVKFVLVLLFGIISEVV